MPEMDAELDDELRSLRARAYSPTADIADDPAAVRRLRELEDLHVRARIGSLPPDRQAESDAGGDPAASSAAETGPAAEKGPAADTAPAGGAAGTSAATETQDQHPPVAPPRFLVRHRTAAWISSLAIAAAAASAATYALVSFAPVATSSGAPQIATLKPDSATEVPAGFFGASEDTPVWEFHGLTFFLGLGGFNSTSGERCFNAFDTAQLPTADAVASGSYGYSGASYSGCQAGVFPATIVVPLDGAPGDVTPETLRARFPDAKALQFVLDGDRIGVFLDSGG